jgi:TRAP-type C4-dicarboxylate transport system permease large subunit
MSLDKQQVCLCYNHFTMEDKPQEFNEQTNDVVAPVEAQKSKLWIFILIIVLVVGLIITIFLSLESVVIGVVLVVLVLQVSTLINLVQNEIKPILKSTTDTINTLKGTTEFLSQNLVGPVIKANSYTAGARRLFDLFKILKK